MIVGSTIIFVAIAVFAFLLGSLAHSAGIDQGTGLWVWVKFYRDGLRSPLFTGFLTLGSFLLTLKVAILIRIKEIYDETDYEVQWLKLQEQRRSSDPTAMQTDFYAPLRRLGLVLLANVLLAILTSIAQVSLGFFNNPWCLGVCLALPAITLLLLVFLWAEISANLLRWFKTIEAKKQKSLLGR